jgi:membrane-bound lytic murein transglycosylase D
VIAANKHILSLLFMLLAFPAVVLSQTARKDTVITIKGQVPGSKVVPSVVEKKQVSPAPTSTAAKAIQTKISKAVTPFDSTRIIKKKAPVVNKNAAKSATDPNALSYGAFKVSPDLYGQHAQIIMEYVQNYHKNFGARLSRVKSNNKGYFTFIDNTMRKQGVPKEMHSLAVIESALNPNAVSGVGATGPWQFMEPTAEMLGLRVDEELDERRDFYKSTLAAARYVKRLHNIFHDWLLVVASYNCGPAPVLRSLSKTGGKSFWDIKHLLPRETQNHVMAFIAVSVYYDRNSKVLDLGNLPKDGAKAKKQTKETPLAKTKSKTKPIPKAVVPADDDSDLEIADEPASSVFDPNAPQFTPEELGTVLTLKVKGAYNLESVAEVLSLDIKKLRRWNPKFNELAYANNGPVNLTIPASAIDAFLVKKQDILSKSLKSPRPTSGETVNLDPRQIAKVPNYANTAKTAHASPSAPSASSKSAAEVAAENAAAAKTKSNAAETVTTHKEENRQTTSAPKQHSMVAKKSEHKTYIVKNGDSLTGIAEQFGLTVARLMELNKLKKPVIHPGHTLYLQ